jgi:hypothetical protein
MLLVAGIAPMNEPGFGSLDAMRRAWFLHRPELLAAGNQIQ